MLREPGAREVIAALPDAIDRPLADRETFRAIANRVQGAHGAEGEARCFTRFASR